jgi:hypothetical protein
MNQSDPRGEILSFATSLREKSHFGAAIDTVSALRSSAKRRLDVQPI